jgi:transcriptional regulator with XRE-family HTH domain
MPELLGDRIRKARERYGMSATELARRIGVSRQLLYMIESNKTPDPGALKVKAIAEVLGVSTDYLLSHRTGRRRPLDEEDDAVPVRVGAVASPY